MSHGKPLAELGEFGLIDRIAANVPKGVGVLTGIGDDAAVTGLSPGMQLLSSTDMLLEDVHFRRSWHDPYRLGRKSLAVSISDIAAMGGIPRWALLSLAVPADLSVEYLDDFTAGLLSMAFDHGVTLIGGDTCASRSGLAISVTIMGEQHPDRIIRRSGARPDDDIWVTGTLGDAALALECLEGRLPAWVGDLSDSLSLRLLDPFPRAMSGRLLAESGLVSAMIDVSDGLIADFGHIAAASGFGGTIRLDALPVSEAFRRIASELAVFPKHLLLSGGEDYELLFTAPAAHREKISRLVKKSGVPATAIGIVSNLPGTTVLESDGTPYLPEKQGFNHFK